mmetsp:Transcript_15145/g.22920  ORF Transcript_15145/g.22920 Transcript_15145/m.22920 type:complete len:88 (-) Transcript_15145:69-332(-)
MKNKLNVFYKQTQFKNKLQHKKKDLFNPRAKSYTDFVYLSNSNSSIICQNIIQTSATGFMLATDPLSSFWSTVFWYLIRVCLSFKQK